MKKALKIALIATLPLLSISSFAQDDESLKDEALRKISITLEGVQREMKALKDAFTQRLHPETFKVQQERENGED